MPVTLAGLECSNCLPMPDSTDNKKPPRWVATIAEEAAAAAPGLVAGALAGPVAGAAGVIAGVGIKGAIAALRGAAATRAQRRASSFETELASLLEEGDPEALTRLAERDDRFAEVIFQNYRRAMDALDPCVIPAIAALTFAYRNRALDGFFKAVGLLLQELTGEEFRALRAVMSAVTAASGQWGGAPEIEVTPWKNSAGRQELHFTTPDNRQSALACVTPPESLRVLNLVQRHGVAPGFSDQGADLALTNRLEVDVTTCERVLAVTGREDVTLFTAVYEHPEPREGKAT